MSTKISLKSLLSSSLRSSLTLSSPQHTQSIAENFPELMGGSADLTPSNLTSLKCSSDFQASTPAGRYIRFGVREHAMAGICNGMFAHGNIRPYCATFLNFAGYALGSIRCSALSKFGVLYVMTHDSIGLGEDGPTHQPIEMIESLRSMPNVNVLRPCDTNETNAAYQIALTQHETPSVICLSRQTLPNLAGTDPAKAQKGGYIVSGDDNTDLVLVGTGSETGLCAKAAEEVRCPHSARTYSMFILLRYSNVSLRFSLAARLRRHQGPRRLHDVHGRLRRAVRGVQEERPRRGPPRHCR